MELMPVEDIIEAVNGHHNYNAESMLRDMIAHYMSLQDELKGVKVESEWGYLMVKSLKKALKKALK